MSEFDRLVGVNAAGDLPNDVRDKLFKSSHANGFKSGTISDAKKLIDDGDSLTRSDLNTKIVALEKGRWILLGRQPRVKSSHTMVQNLSGRKTPPRS